MDDALLRVNEAQLSALARREQLIATAREEDALTAVFIIHYFNCRYSGHTGQYGLGRISLIDALGDLHTREQISSGVARTDALIEEGKRMGIGTRDTHADMKHLRQAHRGFMDAALGNALAWVHLIHW